MPEPDATILRPVSIYEQNLQVYGNVVSRNKIKGKISIPAFRKALEIIALRHPFLTAVFFESAGNLYFKKAMNFSLPLDIKENILKQEEKDNLYREELNNIVNPFEKLWRILIILDCTEAEINEDSYIEIIISVHHYICDGIALFNLIREIMEQVRAVQEGRILYENKRLAVMLPEDTLLKNYFKHSGITITESATDNTIYKDLYRIEIDNSVNEKNCRITFLKETLSEADTLDLANKCKIHKTTVHGILCAALAKGLREMIDKDPEKLIKMGIVSSVNPRKKIAIFPGTEHLICYSDAETAIVFVHQKINLSVLSGKIIEQINHNFANNVGIKELHRISESRTIIKELDSNTLMSLYVSNAGRIDLPSAYGTFQLVETDFSASNKFPGLLLSVTTFNNMLGYHFLYTDPWLKKEFVAELNHHFKKNLLDFISG